jgi:hypothetical protein
MSKDLDRAAEAWDKAQRNGQLNPPTPEPDTRPRDCYNRPITFTPKVTVGGKPLLDNSNNPFR